MTNPKLSQIGSFGDSEDVSYMNCGTGISNSVTHKSRLRSGGFDPTESVKFSWIPPPDFEGAVTIKYSVVKQ